MFEALLAIGIFALLAGGALLFTAVAWEILFGLGLILIVVGMLVGVPAGFWYHVRLYKALTPRGALTARWWLKPLSFHGALTDDVRGGVMRWFYIGGAGFALTVGGLVLFAVGAIRGR